MEMGRADKCMQMPGRGIRISGRVGPCNLERRSNPDLCSGSHMRAPSKTMIRAPARNFRAGKFPLFPIRAQPPRMTLFCESAARRKTSDRSGKLGIPLGTGRDLKNVRGALSSSFTGRVCARSCFSGRGDEFYWPLLALTDF